MQLEEFLKSKLDENDIYMFITAPMFSFSLENVTREVKN